MSEMHLPFVAGLIVGSVLGWTVERSPRWLRLALVASSMVFVYLWLTEGVGALESSVVGQLRGLLLHERFMFGLLLAAVMTFPRRLRSAFEAAE